MTFRMIDACCFLGESLYGNSVTTEELLAKMDKYGIEKAVVRPFKPCDYIYDKANKAIGEEAAENDRLIAFGRVNPLEKTAPEQVAKFKEYGLSGLHLHPWEDNFQICDPRVDATVAVCEELGIPVYVSTGYPSVSEAFQLLELALRFPAVTFIATHAGQLDISGLSFDDVIFMTKKAPNIMYDLSGVYRRDFIENLIRTAGQDHVVFGSCEPYMDHGLEIARIEAAEIPDEWKEQVFAANIEALLG